MSEVYMCKILYPVLKTVWILISWLLKRPADHDPHCFHQYNKFIFIMRLHHKIDWIQHKNTVCANLRNIKVQFLVCSWSHEHIGSLAKLT